MGDGTKAANESAVSPIMNFTMVSPFGNSSDYPFRYGMTADLGQTVYSYNTAHGLMVSLLPQASCMQSSSCKTEFILALGGNLLFENFQGLVSCNQGLSDCEHDSVGHSLPHIAWAAI